MSPVPEILILSTKALVRSSGSLIFFNWKVSHHAHTKVRHLKRLKLSFLKDDIAKSAGEMLLKIESSSASFVGASAY